MCNRIFSFAHTLICYGILSPAQQLPILCHDITPRQLPLNISFARMCRLIMKETTSKI